MFYAVHSFPLLCVIILLHPNPLTQFNSRNSLHSFSSTFVVAPFPSACILPVSTYSHSYSSPITTHFFALNYCQYQDNSNESRQRGLARLRLRTRTESFLTPCTENGKFFLKATPMLYTDSVIIQNNDTTLRRL